MKNGGCLLCPNKSSGSPFLFESLAPPDPPPLIGDAVYHVGVGLGQGGQAAPRTYSPTAEHLIEVTTLFYFKVVLSLKPTQYQGQIRSKVDFTTVCLFCSIHRPTLISVLST